MSKLIIWFIVEFFKYHIHFTKAILQWGKVIYYNLRLFLYHSFNKNWKYDDKNLKNIKTKVTKNLKAKTTNELA